MNRALVLVVLAGCYAAMPPMRFGGGKSESEAQHQIIAELMPPTLTANAEWKGEPAKLKVRVWADDQYRAQNMRWQQGFQDQLDYANSVLGPLLGIELEAEYRAWNRHAPAATLEQSLAELAQQDPGSDVFGVIGLTSALGLVEATFDAIGMAQTPGHYLVLRGYAEVGERQAFDAAFPKVRPDERAQAVEARRHHKMAAVLLHELGHNFGAPHEPEADTIMNARYSVHSASFGARTRDLMLATLAGRLRRPTEQPAHHPKLVITASANGDAVVGGQAVDDETLEGLFKLSVGNDRDTEVIVKPEAGAPHAVVVKIFDLAKRVGLQRLSIEAGR